MTGFCDGSGICWTICKQSAPRFGEIIIIMQRLTHRVLVIRMTNRRHGCHVDLRVAVSVIKRFEFLLKVLDNHTNTSSLNFAGRISF